MFDFIGGLAGAVVKTVVGVPVALAADIITVGGIVSEKREKRGERTYTGDMVESIGDSVDEMTK